MDIAKDDPRRLAEKLAAYYLNARRDLDNHHRDLFPFRALSIKFEPTEHGAFSEVLYPESVYDLIDFFLRENILREQNWRVCKN